MGRRIAFTFDENGQAVVNETFASDAKTTAKTTERNGWWHQSAENRGDVDAASIDWKFGVPPLGSTPMPEHICDNLCHEQEMRPGNRPGCVMVTRIDAEPEGTVYIQTWKHPDEANENPVWFPINSKKLVEQPKTTDRGIEMIGGRPNRIVRVPIQSKGITSAHAYPGGTIRTYRKGEDK